MNQTVLSRILDRLSNAARNLPIGNERQVIAQAEGTIR